MLWGSVRRWGVGRLIGGSCGWPPGWLITADLAGPGLGGHLDGVPGAAERWGVAQVQLAEPLDGHVVEQGGGRDVDALGHLGAMVAQQLSAAQAPAGAVAGDAQVQLVGAWVVGLVVELDRADRDRVEAGLAGVGVAQAGSGHGQLEDLDHLGAEGAGEGRGAAEGGLAGDPALLVGGGAERQVGGRSRRRW